MKLLNNETGVSEIVGAMFILLILVLYLGVMQAYELPKWNKEIEKQGFDLAYKDFLDLRSDIEDSSIKNMPVTSSMHTGVRYPERFMLRNPGQEAYGVFDTYPLRINISYDSNGTRYYKDYTSLGIVYQMKGISDFPGLVYEHGIIIKEFGSANYSDDENRIAKDNGIYIPLLKGFEPLSSTEVETFNILPITDSDLINATSSINVSFETRYPEIWYNMLNKSIPVGSDITYNNTEIRITNIFRPDIFVGFSRNLSLPNTSSISENNIYSGNIRFADDNTIVNAIKINVIKEITNTNVFNVTNTTTFNVTNNLTNNISNIVLIDSSNCSTPGRYIWDIDQGCVNLPTSASAQKFIIKDMKLVRNTNHNHLNFTVYDVYGTQLNIRFDLDSNSTGDAISANIEIPVACGPITTFDISSGEINMTSCYRNANIVSPNVLKITNFEPETLFVKFLIY